MEIIRFWNPTVEDPWNIGFFIVLFDFFWFDWINLNFEGFSLLLLKTLENQWKSLDFEAQLLKIIGILNFALFLLDFFGFYLNNLNFICFSLPFLEFRFPITFARFENWQKSFDSECQLLKIMKICEFSKVALIPFGFKNSNAYVMIIVDGSPSL